MMEERVLWALCDIDEQYILEAAPGASRSAPARRRRYPLRVALLAAVLAVCSLATALAVNEDFRGKIFDFLHISTAESVPHDSSAPPDGGAASLGGGVTAEYLHVGRELTPAGNGILYETQHRDGRLSGASFWRIDSSALRSVKTHTTDFQMAAGDAPVSGTAYWCEAGGSLAAVGSGSADGSRAWSLSAAGQTGKTALLTVFGGVTSRFDFHAYLLDLESGSTAPISPAVLEKFSRVERLELTSDGQYALILGCFGADRTAAPYLCDLTSGRVTALAAAVGADAPGRALFADDDTALFTSVTEGNYSCWAYHLREEKAEKTVDRMSVHDTVGLQGRLVELGGRYALCVYPNGDTAVLDQASGACSAVIDGFPYDSRAELLLDPAGTKACYYVSAGLDGSLSVAALGVIDFEKAEFTLFDRRGFAKNQELRLGWLDESTVGISTGGSKLDLYLYTF